MLVKQISALGILQAIFFNLFTWSFFCVALYHAFLTEFTVFRIVAIIAVFVLSILSLEMIFGVYKTIEFKADETIFRKPWRKYGFFRKRQKEWVLKVGDWDELIHFAHKNESILYFRKNKTVQFVVSIVDGSSITADYFREIYKVKKIEPKSTRNYPIDVVKAFRKSFPERSCL